MRYTVFIALLGVCCSAHAQTMYRCVEGGKTVYQDRPCLGGAEKRMAPDGGPTREDVARARMLARAERERAEIAERAAAAERAKAPAAKEGEPIAAQASAAKVKRAQPDK